jgi:hypothetical protein
MPKEPNEILLYNKALIERKKPDDVVPRLIFDGTLYLLISALKSPIFNIDE